MTPGGTRLRRLREEQHKTQLWVEAEADLGTGYLQRIESGRVAQPGRATLERILTALDVRYSERREILERFGYTVATPPPTAEEIAWARDLSQRELQAATYPAYVLDCTLRLIAWNRFVPALLGLSPDDPHFGLWSRDSFLAAWFDPDSPITPLIAEPHLVLPALVRALRYEIRHRNLDDEPWFPPLLADLHRWPRFHSAWLAVEVEPPAVSAARSLVPLLLNVPNHGQLRFRLSAEPFIRDARFRILSYFPADTAALSWCSTISNSPVERGDRQ
jgi:transcriptional regulator with XRE-family HTH domain